MISANKHTRIDFIKNLHWKPLVCVGWYICTVVALGIFILSVAVQAIVVAENLDIILTAPESPPLMYSLLNIVSLLARMIAALISLILACLLFLKRPDDGMALFLSFFLLVYGIVQAGPLAYLEPLWPGMNVFTYTVITPILFAPFLVTFLSIFPNGRLVPHQARWLVIVSVIYAPVSPLLFTSDSGFLYTIGVLFLFVLVFSGLYAQIHRYLHASNPVERQQTKWVVYGFIMALLFAFLTTVWDISLNHLALETPSSWSTPHSSLGWALAIAVVPLSLTFAVMRYRLYDIDIIINRTLVYGTLMVCVGALYAFSVGVLSTLFQLQGDPIIALVATGLVAVLFQPLRERLQVGINQIFYGQREDPLRALSHLGKRLEAAMTPEEVLPTLVKTIAHTLKLPYVAISLRSGDEFSIAARVGTKMGNTLRCPLIYQGKTIGYLITSPRGHKNSFDQTDIQLLENIAHQAGPSAYAVQLTHDLRQSRVRLVTAREEERRRLRRDLHDGLGPVLASQGLKMAAVSQLLQDNPAQARQLLEELTSQNETTVAEIRRLVYELRPAALDDLGLVGAVHDYASGFEGHIGNSPSLQITVQAPADGLPSLPAAIEVAAYRISTEALTNTARHARACRATVSFALHSGNHTRKLHLEIVDDGIGLPEDHKSGIGLISMRERAEEVGGNFFIESSTGRGTRVIADLPLVEAT